MTAPQPGSRWRRRAGGKHGGFGAVVVRKTSARAVAFMRPGRRDPAGKGVTWLPLAVFAALFAPEGGG